MEKFGGEKVFFYLCAEFIKMVQPQTYYDMKKRRFVMLFAALLMAVVSVKAQDTMQRLVVWQKSGEKVYFDLSEEPETTFEEGVLVIQTSTTLVRYPISDVMRYTYEGEMTAIKKPVVQPGEIVFRQGADELSFDGLPEGVKLEVFSIDGKPLLSETARQGKTTVISLANYPTGIYIVKLGETTYKFLKR